MKEIIDNTDPVKLYNETAKLLKAYGEDPIDHLGQPPLGGEIHTAKEENTMILQGDWGEVRAKLTENHIEHIYTHNELQMSPVFITLNPMQQQGVIGKVQSHIQEHMAMMQQMMVITQRAQANKGANGGQAGTAPNNQGNTPAQSVGAIQEPYASVANKQEQGASGFTPPM